MSAAQLRSALPMLALACVGLAFGLLYFATLQRTVAMLCAGRGWLAPLLLTLGRIAAAAVLFALAARLGAPALLSAVVGFLLARAITLHAARRAC